MSRERLGITLTRDQLEAWAGCPLTDEDVSALAESIRRAPIRSGAYVFLVGELHIRQPEPTRKAVD